MFDRLRDRLHRHVENLSGLSAAEQAFWPLEADPDTDMGSDLQPDREAGTGEPVAEGDGEGVQHP